jgi:hypothetical protein
VRLLAEPLATIRQASEPGVGASPCPHAHRTGARGNPRVEARNRTRTGTAGAAASAFCDVMSRFDCGRHLVEICALLPHNASSLNLAMGRHGALRSRGIADILGQTVEGWWLAGLCDRRCRAPARPAAGNGESGLRCSVPYSMTWLVPSLVRDECDHTVQCRFWSSCDQRGMAVTPAGFFVSFNGPAQNSSASLRKFVHVERRPHACATDS